MTESTSSQGSPRTLYRERQWVPWYWWILLAAFSALVGFQFGLNRAPMWTWVWLFGTFIVGAWVLVWMSRTTITVEADPDGTRWLLVNQANLPSTVVDRSMVVPESAKRNALGRQLDPAAFVVSHGWVKGLTLIVLDDPEDPTPYWLISSKNPQALLEAFAPQTVAQQQSRGGVAKA
ncbi:DUF3093 domain-containing protein [Corynebacterium cystitidis]|uniref:DUF3093 domain-containing protein n=1 Tax=Corynebacterium cystitidis DSM 20524 TaxID=1121357 RepID=A0A1H9P9Y3_9CORY|nr:DUF3093 domain-containing protein [Corynebacterium cystitidis]WJY82570.1 hypothetical protein CCYS_08270 [Corynebacterium cystitidis DSM 20524]SER45002.1 Protein of unknown function [Corynebacterium cystitidis DSM 20524]SNV73299.1 hypothetical membrane protein [Corynebacterium cystitidis]